MNGILQYLHFCDCMIFLRIMSSGFIHVMAVSKFLSFLRLNHIPLYIQTRYDLSFAKGHGLLPSFGYCEYCYFKYGLKVPLWSLLSIIMGIKPEVNFLDHMEILFMFLSNFHNVCLFLPPSFLSFFPPILPSYLPSFISSFSVFFYSFLLFSFFCISCSHSNNKT